MNQGMTCAVDIALCIDATGSMIPSFDMVRERALSMHDDIVHKLSAKDRDVTELRLNVIAFRDVDYGDYPPFEVSGWMHLPDQASEFENFVKAIDVAGGGDEPESGLDAISIAINSDWTANCDRQRHIVILWTDATSKPLSGGSKGDVAENLQSRMLESLDDLTDVWSDPQGSSSLRRNARRMLIYGPDCPDWNTLSEGWDEVMHFPSKAGAGLAEHDYDAILEVLASSIA